MAAFLDYPDTQIQAADLARTVAQDLRTALAQKDQATLAVPGGTTPAAFLRCLSKADLDWSRIRVLLTDERIVPRDSDRSNARLLRENLLINRAEAADFIALHSDADSPEQVVSDLADAVKAVLPLDVCVLGMGADMHIASLFPGTPNLRAVMAPDCAQPLAAMHPPTAPEPRLSLTGPVLTAAARIHLLIKGPEKRTALDRAAQTDCPLLAPVKLVLSHENLTIHYTKGPRP